MNREKLTEILKKYLPNGTENYATDLLEKYRIQMRITKPRESRFGDYMPPSPGENHKISINHNLNQYAFLITFLHEIAHLRNFEKFKNNVAPHGIEWKKEFQQLSVPVFTNQILPADVHRALLKYLSNPKASSCSDPNLTRTLRKYDADQSWILVEEVPIGATFIVRDGTMFVKIEKLRTRFKCLEKKSGMIYFVPGIMECKLIQLF